MNILLVDDHALFREGMKFLLRRLDERVAIEEAETTEEAIALAGERVLDLVLLDLKLPGLGGMEALDAMRASSPQVPVVVLSGEGTPRLVRESVERGAMGFIPKSSSHEVLIGALRLVLAGEVYLPASVLEDVARPLGGGAGEAPPRPPPGSPAGAVQALSPRQLEVLRCVIQGKPNKVIARELHVSEHTVKAHLSTVLRVLGVRNRTEAVYVAARQGLQLG